MPQLDFTLWMANLLTNWLILVMVFLYINSDSITPPNLDPKTTMKSNLAKETNKKWPW